MTFTASFQHFAQQAVCLYSHQHQHVSTSTSLVGAPVFACVGIDCIENITSYHQYQRDSAFLSMFFTGIVMILLLRCFKGIKRWAFSDENDQTKNDEALFQEENTESSEDEETYRLEKHQTEEAEDEPKAAEEKQKEQKEEDANETQRKKIQEDEDLSPPPSSFSNSTFDEGVTRGKRKVSNNEENMPPRKRHLVIRNDLDSGCDLQTYFIASHSVDSSCIFCAQTNQVKDTKPSTDVNVSTLVLGGDHYHDGDDDDDTLDHDINSRMFFNFGQTDSLNLSSSPPPPTFDNQAEKLGEYTTVLRSDENNNGKEDMSEQFINVD